MSEKIENSSSSMGEFDIIARFFRPLSDKGHGLDLEDDTALLKVQSGQEMVMTSDALVAGVHFFPDDKPGDIAAKTLGVNLSDIIAKGATPHYYLLTLVVPPGIDSYWLEHFSAGLKQVQEHYGCTLVGGDTVSTDGPLTLSVTMVGTVLAGRMVRRSTAETGDHIYVSGTIGDAVAGLALRQDGAAFRQYGLVAGDKDYLTGRYLRPGPRLALSGLVKDFATAAMDISDGLIGDLEKLCTVSGKGAGVELPQVPVHPALQQAVRQDPDLFSRLVTGGDDYEVLMTVAPHNVVAFEAQARTRGLVVTGIGKITNSIDGFRYYDLGRREVQFSQKSYSHL